MYVPVLAFVGVELVWIDGKSGEPVLKVNLVPFPGLDYDRDFLTATDAPCAAPLRIDEAPMVKYRSTILLLEMK